MISPFRISVPDSELELLRSRLESARWPDELPGVGWSYGTALNYVQDLAEYWRTGYDWPAAQAALNTIDQFTTVIDGQNVHFGHVRSSEPDALPLILTHGWPSTFADFAKLVGPLTDPRAHGGDPADAFHVVIPSIPGFGFSGPTTAPGWGIGRIAAAWAELMRRLGYRRYGTHGGDFGAKISPEVARIDPEHVVGVHVNALTTMPSADTSDLTETETARMAGLERWHRELSGYAMVQSTRPQSLAFALVDSPTGQLAWYADWFAGHGDKIGAVDRDDILTAVTQYWVTGTAGSAARLYREAASSWGRAVSSGVPTAVAVFRGDSSIRRFAEAEHHIVAWSEFDSGGHFAALEVPELLTGDIRRFFRTVR